MMSRRWREARERMMKDRDGREGGRVHTLERSSEFISAFQVMVIDFHFSYACLLDQQEALTVHT